MKITEANYQLHEVIAMQIVDTLDNGANLPLIILGANLQTKATAQYVLKYRGVGRMDKAACGRELLASFLASELGLSVPQPVIIHVTDRFINTAVGNVHYQNISKSKGLNFGSKYLEGAVKPKRRNLSSKQLQQAAEIFCFDAIMQNGDRNVNKPNCFVVNEKIYVIDHEIEYGFLVTLPMFRSPEPWLINNFDVESFKKHYFFPDLHQNRRVTWEEVGSTVADVSEQFWEQARALVPLEWMTEAYFNDTKNYFKQIQNNFSTFKSELWNKVLTA